MEGAEESSRSGIGQFHWRDAMSTKKTTAHITQAELDRAIAKYLRDGGRIMKLPEQKPFLHSRVGGRLDSNVIDTLSPG
jgi:hypothetical protein